MDFSKLFLDKHGKVIFEEVTNKINEEKTEECNLEYISIVFKIAFLDFFGLDKTSIQKLINSIYNDKTINIENILSLHMVSVETIKKYLQFTMDIN